MNSSFKVLFGTNFLYCVVWDISLINSVVSFFGKTQILWSNKKKILGVLVWCIGLSEGKTVLPDPDIDVMKDQSQQTITQTHRTCRKNFYFRKCQLKNLIASTCSKFFWEKKCKDFWWNSLKISEELFYIISFKILFPTFDTFLKRIYFLSFFFSVVKSGTQSKWSNQR